MSQLYALLIAVDYYIPGQLPGGGYYPNLGGCVRDVRHVEEFLKSRLKLPDEHILKLSASATGSQPPEPLEQLPTYTNMVARFRQLTAMAQPGDQVYIHYSGHGGRTVTAYPQLKGANGFDEALVPTDIHNAQASYLRDVELAYLLRDMVEKGLIVTVVLDSCHSGGATRNEAKAVKRGIGITDTTVRPPESLVAAADALANVWQAAGGSTRAVKPASGWLLEPKGYTLLAACRANESAYEFAFDGKERNGALTYWLLDTLRRTESAVSYKALFDRILAKVHGQFEQQTPQLQGEGNRIVFGSAELQPHHAINLLKVEGNRLQLNAGEGHGLHKGAQVAVYPHGVADLSVEAGRLAVADVEQVSDVTAWATVTERLQPTPIEAGAQAVLLHNLRLQRHVALVLKDAALETQVAEAIATNGKGFIKVAEGGEEVDFQVAVNENGEYAVLDPAGEALPNLRPALRVGADGALTKLVGRLVHLAKYRNVQMLDAPDLANRQKLEVELTSPPVVRPGDAIQMSITNQQMVNPSNPNDSSRILNISVLNLGSDWSIQQIYPAEGAAFEPLDPGQAFPLEFEADLPRGQAENLHILKTFGSQATTDFRWLELPPLDQPDPRGAMTRSVIRDPLEQMLAAITGDTASTRTLRLTRAGESKKWTTRQVEVRVQR